MSSCENSEGQVFVLITIKRFGAASLYGVAPNAITPNADALTTPRLSLNHHRVRLPLVAAPAPVTPSPPVPPEAPPPSLLTLLPTLPLAALTLYANNGPVTSPGTRATATATTTSAGMVTPERRGLNIHGSNLRFRQVLRIQIFKNQIENSAIPS